MGHGFSKVSYVSASVRVWRVSMERRDLSYITSAGLIIQALWWALYLILFLPKALQLTGSASGIVIGAMLLICPPCIVIPLWMAWGVWTRRRYNFLLGLWTTWALYYGLAFCQIYFYAINRGLVFPPDLVFVSIVGALMHIPPACISATYIFTTPPVPEDQWW